MTSGTVLYGINNIFTVYTGDGTVECRIKGKTLKAVEGVYNPLAPGDRVEYEPDGHRKGFGLIVSRMDRENALSRWNRKKKRIQTIAANIDMAACVSSAASPPFRPRFIDRVLLEAERAGIPAIVILNKTDLILDEETGDRLRAFENAGYPVYRCSAATGEGLETLGEAIRGKRIVFLGQSGVGKSTLLNALYADLSLRTGDVSKKYDRGAHTTVYSVMISRKDGDVIDTPGIREIEIHGMEYGELAHAFREFRAFSCSCRMRNCRHLDEPNCAVRRAVDTGGIHPDRYESYRSILMAMERET